MFQQNLDKHPLSIVVLNSLTSKIGELALFIPAFKLKVDSFEKHKAYLMDKYSERTTWVNSMYVTFGHFENAKSLK
jgi:hypothetical protein